MFQYNKPKSPVSARHQTALWEMYHELLHNQYAAEYRGDEISRQRFVRLRENLTRVADYFGVQLKES